MSATKTIIFWIELETGLVLARFTGTVSEGEYEIPPDAKAQLERTPGTCLAAGLLYSDGDRLTVAQAYGTDLAAEFDRIVAGDCITDDVARHQEIVAQIRRRLRGKNGRL